MRRSLSILTLVLVLAALLCGCNSARQEIVCNELQIDLPAAFIDFSEEGAKEGLAFNYADTEIGVCGSFEEKTYLQQYFPDIDPAMYAKLFLESNGIASQVETADAIPRFTYSTGGYTYLCGVFESGENYWVVQSYCKTEDFPANKETMWGYIASVILG